MAPPEMTLVQQVLGLSSQHKLAPNLTDAVLICIDCEAFEHSQQKVTELGVAVLDTKDLAGVTAGEIGEGWVAKMQYAHYRPIEYARYVNRRFVKGAEDKFAFGDTTWIHLADAAKVLARIFQCPERLGEAARFATNLPDNKRNIVFVAHGISNDDAYLHALGFNLGKMRNVVRQIDSQRVSGGTKKNSLGLKRLLEKLGIACQGLHNAGNDAAYTLQAVVAMAVKEQKQPGLIYREGKLPSICFPGVVRAESVSAKHVYSGTILPPAVPPPVDGGKPAQAGGPTYKGRKGAPAGKTPVGKQTPPQQARASSNTSLRNSGRYMVKRPAPSDEESEEQPAKKKQAR